MFFKKFSGSFLSKYVFVCWFQKAGAEPGEERETFDGYHVADGTEVCEKVPKDTSACFSVTRVDFAGRQN